MGQNDEGYIIIPNPINPTQRVRAKVLDYQKIQGEDHIYRLNDGTRIKLVVEVDTISRPIDPESGKPVVNPATGEPVININWGVRVMTMYSAQALDGFKGVSTK
jgi:hypothetical protein